MLDFDILDCVGAPTFVLNVAIAERPRFAFWNVALEEITDIPRSVVLGMSPSRILSGGQLLVEAAQIIATTGLGDVRVIGMGEVSLTLADDGVHLIGTLVAGDQEEKDREVFLSMAAHDLRAPLRNISSLACELNDQALGEDGAQMLGMIGAVVSKAMTLTNEIISYSQAARAELNDASRFELSETVAHIFSTLDPAGTHTLNAMKASVQTDKAALQVLLRNLLDNALRHADRDCVKIGVGVEADSAAGWLKFTVTDNGKGFDQPALAFLGGGDLRYDSGYGLLGVRRLVAARGGEIKARPPKSGSGSEISFTLPGVMLLHEATNAAVA